MKLRHGIGLAFAAATLVSTSLAHAQTGVSDDRVSLPDGPGSLAARSRSRRKVVACLPLPASPSTKTW